MMAAAIVIIFSAGWLARSFADRGIVRPDLGQAVQKLRRTKAPWI